MSTTDTISGYALSEILAEGGSGRVYKGERDGLTVAVKVLRAPGDAQQRARFDHERRFLEQLDHPRISRYVDSGYTDAGAPYIATAFISGVPINRYADEQELSQSERVRLIVRCAALLQFAHSRGVIHRDVKPANLLVDEQGHVHLLDFGISKASVEETLNSELTTHGQLLGTLIYMSPEQLTDARTATASTTDIYSLGVVAYELLTGAAPFRLESRSLQATIVALSEGQARDLEALDRLGAPLAAVIRKMFHPEPERRYQAMSEVQSELHRWLNNEPVLAKPPSVGEQLGQFVRRNRLLAGSALAVFSVTVLAALISASFYLRESDARQLAETAQKESALQLRRTRGLTDFLVEMIQSSNPERGGSNALTVKEVLVRALNTVEGDISEDPEIEATIRCTIAVSMLTLGDQAEAEAQAIRGLARVETLQESDAWEECTLALGQAQFYRLASDEARQHFEALLARTRKPRFSNDVVTKAELNLAIMDSYEGRFEATRARMQALVDTPFSVLAELDEYRLYGVHEYGVSLWGLGRFEEAESALSESVRLRTTAFDARHPQTLFSKLYLGRVKAKLGDFHGAQALLAEVVNARALAYGDAHRQTLLAKREMLHVLVDMGALDLAEPISQQLELSLESVGAVPALTVQLSGAVARYAAMASDTARAEALYAPVINYLDGLETTPAVTSVLQYRREYAEFLLMNGRVEEGLAQLDHAVAQTSNLLGEDNLMTTQARFTRSQASAHFGTGTTKTDAQDRRAAVRMLELFPAQHPELAQRF